MEKSTLRYSLRNMFRFLALYYYTRCTCFARVRGFGNPYFILGKLAKSGIIHRFRYCWRFADLLLYARCGLSFERHLGCHVIYGDLYWKKRLSLRWNEFYYTIRIILPRLFICNSRLCGCILAL